MSDLPVVAVIEALPGAEKEVAAALGATGEHLASPPAVHPLRTSEL